MTNQDINALNKLEREALIQLWQEHFQSDPPKSLSLPLIKRFLAFELQSKNGKGLSAWAKRKLRQLQNPQRTERPSSPDLQTGSQLIREWNGIIHRVEVVDKGFEWKGKRYRSLSAIAKAITGAHWSGPRFFGLTKCNPKSGNRFSEQVARQTKTGGANG